VPDAREIAAINFAQGRQTAGWSPGLLLSNYPMTLDRDGGQVRVVFGGAHVLSAPGRHPDILAD
jgi:hypothetical protein